MVVHQVHVLGRLALIAGHVVDRVQCGRDRLDVQEVSNPNQAPGSVRLTSNVWY